MKDVLFIDFETGSEVDLSSAGLWNYVQHPSTFVYMLGYAFNDEPGQVWYPHEDFPERIVSHVHKGLPVVAHNAGFEYMVWNQVLFQTPALELGQLICTMARCFAMSLPGSLENAAAALKIDEGKDVEGHALMMRMCKPKNITGGKVTWIKDMTRFTFLGKKVTPEWAIKRLAEYCVKDVEVEREVYHRTLPLSPYQKRVWETDQRINLRGFRFDREAAEAALKIKEDTKKELDKQMAAVTSKQVMTCSALIPLKEWVRAQGVEVDSLAKEPLSELLAADDTPPEVKKALELRQEAGRATSVAKLEKALDLMGEDDRVRFTFQWHGAGTGRWAGRGIQAHNFPRDLPSPTVVEDIMASIRGGDAELLSLMYGPALTVISGMLRAFLLPAGGKRFVGGDWSNVEGRGVAWLAGEEWKLDAFRECDADPSLPDMYERAYAKSFGIPATEVTSEQRQYGKVQELAFGYAGGVGAYRQMGKAKVAHLSDDYIDGLKDAWRGAHPMTKQYWAAIQWAAIKAVQDNGAIVSVANFPQDRRWDLPKPPASRAVKFRKRGSFLWALLPSGRMLCYPYPEIREGRYGPQLTYLSRPSQKDWAEGRVIEDPKNSRAWARISTYGGKLTENVTQATCADFLMETLLALEMEGYEPVIHIHDEVIVEGLLTESDRGIIERIMCTPPEWARDFPLAAGCWLADRYQK